LLRPSDWSKNGSMHRNALSLGFNATYSVTHLFICPNTAQHYNYNKYKSHIFICKNPPNLDPQSNSSNTFYGNNHGLTQIIKSNG